MSTNAAVRTAWNTNVMANLTANVYSYEIIPESQNDEKLGYLSQKVNFFVYLVSSVERPFMLGKNIIQFTVQLIGRIERDKDGTGTNHNALLDAFRDINDDVNDNLGVSWDSTVDRWEGPTEIKVSAEQWGSVPIWQAVQTYTAFKTVNN